MSAIGNGVIGHGIAEIFAKGLTWALQYDSEFTPADIELLKKALQRGRERAEAIENGKQPWAGKKGKLARGYISAVDGSVQPYGVIVPAKYDGRKPMRLRWAIPSRERPCGRNYSGHDGPGIRGP